MKKRWFIFVLALTAAASAVFALCGCKPKPVTDNGDRYVICDDGYGRTYRFDGGEELVTFYQYDPDLTLKFTVNYYSEQTDEFKRSYEIEDLSCSRPAIREYTISITNGGVERESRLKVIVAAQAVSAQLTEGRELFRYVHEDAGETYSFKAPITGNYTISCIVDEENSKNTVDYVLTGPNGEPVEGKLEAGWIYYLQVCVKKNDTSDISVPVSTTVTFTPPEIKLGDNDVNLELNGNIFAFTPEEYGVYSFTDDADGGAYEILDGETLKRITDSQWENEAVLGKKLYYVHSQIGYQTPRAAVLTVRRIGKDAIPDREISPDTEAGIVWNRFYVFNADKKANYHFKLQSDTLSSATTFTVYDDELSVDRRTLFIKNGEFDIMLDKGKHIIRTTDDCKITISFAPVAIGAGKPYANVKAGELISFIPPVTCNYTYETHYDCEVTVTDTEGNAANGVLEAGAEYYLYCSEDNIITVCAIADEIKVLNAEIEAGGFKVVSFTPTVEGNYAFFGATEIEIYQAYYLTAVDTNSETYGYSAHLKDNVTYLAVIKGGSLTYGDSVLTKFYPATIPNDLTTQIEVEWGEYNRIELPVGGNIALAKFKDYGDVTMTLTDADLIEIKTAVNTLSAENLEAGTYFVKCVYSHGPQTIGYTAYPHLAGENDTVTVEEGVKYVSDGSKTYLFAAADFANGGYFTVKVYARTNLAINALTVYRMSGQSRSTLTFEEIKGTEHQITFKFRIAPGYGIYYIKPEFPIEFEVNRV